MIQLLKKIFKALDEFKRGRKRKLYQKSPGLATFLRSQYMSIPDVRVLTYIFASQKDSRLELSKVMALIALESPDTFLNLLCEEGKEPDFQELLKGSTPDVSNEGFRQDLLDIGTPDGLYNFVYQIWHVGILHDGTTAVHQHDDLVMDKFYWEWDEELIGRLASTL